MDFVQFVNTAVIVGERDTLVLICPPTTTADDVTAANEALNRQFPGLTGRVLWVAGADDMKVAVITETARHTL